MDISPRFKSTDVIRLLGLKNDDESHSPVQELPTNGTFEVDEHKPEQSTFSRPSKQAKESCEMLQSYLPDSFKKIPCIRVAHVEEDIETVVQYYREREAEATGDTASSREKTGHYR
jgi:hypothetical protein